MAKTKKTPPEKSAEAITQLAAALKNGDMPIARVKLADLKIDTNNAKKHGPQNRDAIKRSIEKFGQVEPLVIQKSTMRIIGGNERCSVMIELGYETATVVILDINDMLAKELAIILNRTPELGMWNEKVLAQQLAELQTVGGVDRIIGFTADEMKRLTDRATADAKAVSQLAATEAATVEELADLPIVDGLPEAMAQAATTSATSGESVTDTGDVPEFKSTDADPLPGVQGLKEIVIFPSKEIFDIPPLKVDMLADLPSRDIGIWTKNDKRGKETLREAANYLAIYGMHDGIEGDAWRRTIIGFYTEDENFDDCWFDPAIFASQLMFWKPYACIMPEFSTSLEMPMAEEIYAIYRQRWVARYWQEAGIKIIPHIPSLLTKRAYTYGLAGIPRNAPVVATELLSTGNDTEDTITQRRDTLTKVIEILKPKSLLLHAEMTKKTRAIIDGLFPENFPVIYVNTVNAQRMRPPKK